MAYVGGYQGAPVSHLLDVMVQAKPYLDELGVHVEACSNEASAAAMLGASIHYPLRGAVTWKSIVGTNVAADALSNLSSPGVIGGALIVVGEDYGEGASVIQERTHAYALKSTMCCSTRGPTCRTWCDMVEEGFRAVRGVEHAGIMELRIRACHVRGSFECKDNVAPQVSTRALMEEPAAVRLHAPGASAGHLPPREAEGRAAHSGRAPLHRRAPAQRAFSRARTATSGIIVQGGLYNALVRSLQQLGLADAFGALDDPVLVLNVTYPAGARADRATSASASARCWWSRKASPSTSSRRSPRCCAGATSRRRCTARTCCRRAGEYTSR